MVPIKVKILFLMSISVLFTYAGILYLNYDEISDIVPTHINHKGEVDGWGEKIHLWIAIGVNTLLLSLIWFVIKIPKHWSYPYELNETNKEKFIYKARIFLSALSIAISIVFSTMIFNALEYGAFNVVRLLFSILIAPLLFVVFYTKLTIKCL